MRACDFRRALVAAVAFAAACGGDSAATSPPEPAPVPVARVTVTNPLVALIGIAEQLTATTFDADGRALTGRMVSWTSSDTSKATVSSSGQVLGIAEGNVTITATSEGQSGSTDLLVFHLDVDSVSVTPPNATVRAGGTQQLTATPYSRTGLPFPAPVTWSSSDISKATVSASGLVTALAVGSVTITATSEGVSGRASITVAP